MKTAVKTSLMLAALATLAAPSSFAREVAGLITDQVTGVPLAAATIIIVETGDMAITNGLGQYYFPNIPEGTYSVLVGKAGYVPLAMGDVAVRASCCQQTVGDANGSGGNEPTIGDVSSMIDAKFISGSCTGIIVCIAEADINRSGGTSPACEDITIGDISALIDYLFITGPSLGLGACP